MKHNYEFCFTWLLCTTDEMGPTGKGHKSQSARDFVNFYNEVKSKKVDITNKEILKFSKLFEAINVFFIYIF
jgi:hypothetical protein